MEEVLILAGAVAFDLALGEYPPSFHPVVWMGKLTDKLLDFAPKAGARRQLLLGAVLALFLPALFGGGAWWLLEQCRNAGSAAYVLAGILVLKPAFSLRGLWSAATSVRSHLDQGDLPGARFQVHSLVSRDVATLSPRLIAAATIESVAENFTDSVVAPLCYFVLFGPAGALAYRAINTLDSMVGYHGQYEYLGRPAARMDDAFNLIPARLAALLLLTSAGPAGGNVAPGWRTMWRDHGMTESPNAGWTMAAMAGALGVRLEKQDAYRLGAEFPEPEPNHIQQALFIYGLATALALLLAFFVLAVRYVR